MERLLNQFVQLLQTFNCQPTFPITSVVLQRNPRLIQDLARKGVEFAIHGYTHVDYSALPYDEQRGHLLQATRIFADHRIAFKGFRAPYLRWNTDTIQSVREQAFFYDNSQALWWNVPLCTDTAFYRRALAFYHAQPADQYPSLPWMEDGLVRMPYALPDDEALVERLHCDALQMTEVWLSILQQVHQLDELFVLGLHPERFHFCQEALTATLSQARIMQPAIWFGRLDEIAAWWQARLQTTVSISPQKDSFEVRVEGPAGVTVLARAVSLSAPQEAWWGSYRRVRALSFTVYSAVRPWIGVSSRSAKELVTFLRQQGYIVEIGDESAAYTVYFDQPVFDAQHQRLVLRQIEEARFPLLRLGRWPNGSRGALAITGDIDALTWWDYGARILGR
ncbi:MAG: hypothetical protein D6796_14750 [Caldilineae bacterium]|nr:MAG: hypothetical protein D6796_14750 [Caldilineae bacterium]